MKRFIEIIRFISGWYRRSILHYEAIYNCFSKVNTLAGGSNEVYRCFRIRCQAKIVLRGLSYTNKVQSNLGMPIWGSFSENRRNLKLRSGDELVCAVRLPSAISGTSAVFLTKDINEWYKLDIVNGMVSCNPGVCLFNDIFEEIG